MCSEILAMHKISLFFTMRQARNGLRSTSVMTAFNNFSNGSGCSNFSISETIAMFGANPKKTLRKSALSKKYIKGYAGNFTKHSVSHTYTRAD